MRMVKIILRINIIKIVTPGSGTFEFEEFAALVSSVEEDEGATDDELRQIFKLFDKEVSIKKNYKHFLFF
jgi:Ca2+-binding EF-hand superfamily protein